MISLEMVRAAVKELGDGATTEEVTCLIRTRFTEPVDIRFMLVYLATIRGEEQLRQARDRVSRIVAEEAETSAKKLRARRG